MRHTLFASLCAVLLMTACSGGSSGSATSNSSANTGPAAGQSNGAFQVYVEALNEPFIVQRTRGRLSGFEYDLLQAIAEKQGLRLEFHPASWDDLFTAMDTGKADIIASNITVTPKRQQQMNFTEPHLESTTAVLLAKGTQAKSFADLNTPDITMNFQSGTYTEELIKQLWPQIQSAPEPSSFSQVNALLTGKSNAAAGDMYVLSFYARLNRERGVHLLVDDSQPKEAIAFGVRKDNPDLLKQLNDGLAAVRADGTYDRIIHRWFGQTVPGQAASHPAEHADH